VGVGGGGRVDLRWGGAFTYISCIDELKSTVLCTTGIECCETS